jgi:quercetin dioxygenase-like cupin family protein
MDTSELKNVDKIKNNQMVGGATHIVIEPVEYKPNAIISKSVMEKATGSITAMAFAKGEGLNEKVSPFDTYVHIIDGSAHIVIDGIATTLTLGQGIIIPAHKANHIDPNGRFKLLLTVIKSGYED